MKKRIFFSDIETSDFKDKLEKLEINSYELEFKLGCIIEFDYNNDNPLDKLSFTDNNDYNKELISKCNRNNKKIIYFHNLKFDSKFFIDFLFEKFDIVKVIRTDSKIIAIKCFKLRKNSKQLDCILEFKDSLSILLVSIKRLGKMLNFPKLEFNFDYSDLKKAINYCFRDCEIIYYALKKLYNAIMNEFNLTNNRTKKPLQFYELPLTIASLSKKIIMLYYPEVFYKVDKHLERRLREHYFGGRTEAFDFNKAENASYLDENSEYPFLLSSREFSNGQTYMFAVDSVNFNRSKNILAYEVLVKENLYYPIYPKRVNGIIFFPKTTKRVIMTKFEYNYLKKNGYFKRKDIEILEVYFEFRVVEIITFKELFLLLYNLRHSYSSKHIFNYIFKIVMNSGYGKFAEKPEKEVYDFIGKEIELTLEVLEKDEYYEFDNVVLKKSEMYQDYLKINLFNAILTTSYARFDIWIMLEKCRLKGIKGFYTDTDSIVVNNEKLDKLKSHLSNEFGKWKIEQQFKYFQAIDSKEYIKEISNEKVNKKTILMYHTNLFSLFEFNSKFKGVSNKYLDTLNKMKSHLKKGTKVNLIGSFFYCQNRKSDNKTVHIIEKHKNSFYNKRIILDDLTTIPLVESDLTNERLKEIEISNKKHILAQIDKL